MIDFERALGRLESKVDMIIDKVEKIEKHSEDWVAFKWKITGAMTLVSILFTVTICIIKL